MQRHDHRTVRRRIWIPLIVAGLLLGAATLTGVQAAPAKEPATSGQVDWPALEDAAIRPGVSIAGGCTAAFVFSDVDIGTLYISSASHCFPNQRPGDQVPIAGIPDAGVIAYCSWQHEESYDVCADGSPTVDDRNDFALVRVKDAHVDDVHPAVLHWGGPTDMALEAPATGERVLTYGDSSLHPDATNHRQGLVMDEIDDSSWTTEAYFVHPSVPGDSGSPGLVADGKAFGVLSYISLAGGVNGLTNLHQAVPFAEEKMDADLQLETYRLLDDGVPDPAV